MNFYHLYYCSLDESVALFIPIGLFASYVCFYVLGSTADGYLSQF
jgi:hypothetical protein